MFLPNFSIKRPVAASMMITTLIIFGVIGFSRLGVSLFPDVDFPMVTVTTTWQNARPEEVDNDITDKLEDAISAVSGIKHISSQSLQGMSRITIEFELDKNVDVAAQEVRDKVSARLGRLPDDADVPVVDKLDINAQPIMWLAVTGQQAIEDLTKIADEQIRPILQKIQGVGEVRVGGGREREVQVWLSRERLAAYQVGVNDVINAIRQQHIEVPGGKLESRDKEFLIHTIGEFPTATAFNDLIVTYRKGAPIRLAQLGYALAGREESRPAARFTSHEGVRKTVALGVAPRSGANEVAIATRVKQALPEVRRILPEGMRIEIASDTTRFIEESINELRFQLLLGAIAAALVIFLFLQNLRTTLISSIAIPTSIVATFACMYALGFTMNNMSMLGLVMAVGLVIDDAIVMVENIFRHRSALGKGPMKAAFEGASEVGFAVIATTVALAGVFLPVAFMGGIVGRFFYEFAVTVAFAISASTFVALTVVPMLSSRFLKLAPSPRPSPRGGEGGPGGTPLIPSPPSSGERVRACPVPDTGERVRVRGQKGNSDTIKLNSLQWRAFHVFDRIMEAGSALYRKALSYSLRHRLLVVMMAVAALVAGGWFFNLLGKEFITEEDQSRFLVRFETPLSYSIDKTDEILKRVEEKLRSVPEISHFFAISGFGGSNRALAFVTMAPKNQRTRTQQEIQSVVRRLLKEIPDVRGSATPISPLGGGQRNEDIQLVIQGPGIETIDHVSRRIMERLSQTAGYSGITRDLEIGKPEVRIKIDRDKAAEAGISVENIATTVGALIGGVDVTTFKEGGKSYDVRLRLEPEQRQIPRDIQRLWIRGGDSQLLDISNFITVEEGLGPSVINRLDRQRSTTIYSNLEGKILGGAMPEVQRIAQELLPEGYTMKFAGRAETFAETGKYIAFAFILAIVLTYIVLAAQFESFTQPFAIMMGLPLSFVGGFGLLLLLGNTFNLFSMIGLVLLVGLVTKNGILLIDYTNKLRGKGMAVHDALVEAGATRLRPILMTAISTIAGVLPVAIGIGIGSESRQPMAVAIAGGLLSSTFLTLAVVPVIYSYLDQLSHWKVWEKFKTSIMAHE